MKLFLIIISLFPGISFSYSQNLYAQNKSLIIQTGKEVRKIQFNFRSQNYKMVETLNCDTAYECIFLKGREVKLIKRKEIDGDIEKISAFYYHKKKLIYCFEFELGPSTDEIVCAYRITPFFNTQYYLSHLPTNTQDSLGKIVSLPQNAQLPVTKKKVEKYTLTSVHLYFHNNKLIFVSGDIENRMYTETDYQKMAEKILARNRQ